MLRSGCARFAILKSSTYASNTASCCCAAASCSAPSVAAAAAGPPQEQRELQVLQVLRGHHFKYLGEGLDVRHVADCDSRCGGRGSRCGKRGSCCRAPLQVSHLTHASIENKIKRSYVEAAMGVRLAGVAGGAGVAGVAGVAGMAGVAGVAGVAGGGVRSATARGHRLVC